MTGEVVAGWVVSWWVAEEGFSSCAMLAPGVGVGGTVSVFSVLSGFDVVSGVATVVGVVVSSGSGCFSWLSISSSLVCSLMFCVD